MKKMGLCVTLLAWTVLFVWGEQTEGDDQPQTPPTKSFIYKKTKQADLEIVVHYPAGWKDTDKRPAIVFFFGGGWTSGTIKHFEPQATYLASRGMVAATGRLSSEVTAWRHAQGMRRGCQECRSVDAAERRQARHRSRPHRGGRWIGGRPHRRLHGLDARPGSRRRGYENLVQAQCPGPFQPGPCDWIFRTCWDSWGMTRPWRRRSPPPCTSRRTRRPCCSSMARPTDWPPKAKSS